MKVKRLSLFISLAVLLTFTVQITSANQALNYNEYFSFFRFGDVDKEQIQERYQLQNRLSECDCDCENECDCDCDQFQERIQDRIQEMIQDRLQEMIQEMIQERLHDGNCTN